MTDPRIPKKVRIRKKPEELPEPKQSDADQPYPEPPDIRIDTVPIDLLERCNCGHTQPEHLAVHVWPNDMRLRGTPRIVCTGGGFKESSSDTLALRPVCTCSDFSHQIVHPPSFDIQKIEEQVQQTIHSNTWRAVNKPFPRVSIPDEFLRTNPTTFNIPNLDT